MQDTEGQKVESELNNRYGAGRAVFIKGDVRVEQEFEAAFLRTKEAFGGIDVLVNNAGVATINGNYVRTIDINLTALIRGCFFAAEHMATDKGGSGGQIINIASAGGLTKGPYDPTYMASKHGVVGFTRCISTMFGPRGISVKCICPTFVNTKFSKTHLSVLDTEEKRAFAAVRQAYGVIDQSEVVTAFQDLLDAEDTNGAVIRVDPSGVKYVYTGKEENWA